MREFRVGDRVECVDGFEMGNLRTGNIYTVTEVYSSSGSNYLRIDNITNSGWYTNRFKLISEAKMDIKERIEGLTEWDKEADDIASKLNGKSGGAYRISIFLGKRGGIGIHQDDYGLDKPLKEFHFETQCEKLQAFKDALLWLADKAGLLDDKKELREEIEQMKKQLQKLEDKL